MTTEEAKLWKKIECFQLNDEQSSFQFSERLSRENGWSSYYTEQVIKEYKKFIFLCCISQKSVTPSDQVDQAWHLHLTYTKSYWIDLCQNTLSKEIHHNPTKGGKAEGEKFDNQYSSTLDLYRKTFKMEPPKTIWPSNSERFSDIHFQRINLRKFWVIKRPKLNNKRNFILALLFCTLIIFNQSTSDENVGINLFILFMLIVIIANRQLMRA